MIDNCGLPTKFTFHTRSRQDLYLVDFADTDSKTGNPHLSKIDDSYESYMWTYAEIARNIDRGAWVIEEVILETNAINVEDLL